MLCPSCRAENSENSKFCSECGTKLKLVCASCTQASPLGNKFCGKCGAPLEQAASAPEQTSERRHATGERRQITVVFCDIVGYTNLAASVDAEKLQQVVKTYEEICTAEITRFDGFVYQRVGDGIVAFFGYPRAHEAEAERAILAGRQILDALAAREIKDVGHLNVRIGIATGIVVTSGTEVAAYGETMNLAARLQSVAEPGSIVVSEQVRRLAGGAFEYEDLGPTALKGIQDKTRIFRITKLGSTGSRFDAAKGAHLTELVGREAEVELLRARMRQVVDGEGHAVLLVGEPGIGKSRILSVLRDSAEQSGSGAMQFQCSPFYTNTAFYPIIEGFKRAFAIGLDDTASNQLQQLEDRIVNHFGLSKEDVRFVASVLAIPHEGAFVAHDMTPQKFKQETIRTLVQIIATASRRSMKVLVFEDAHWADPTTIEVLDALIEQVGELPLLVVITFRPEFVEHWSDRGEVDLLSLSKLSRRQCETIVRSIAGNKAVPQGLVDQIIEHTDGVPLFVEELTKTVLESDKLQELGDRFEYTNPSKVLTVPATLRDSLISRLDRQALVKEVAQIGAAIGRSFQYKLVAAVSPYAASETDEALKKLSESGLVFRKGRPPDEVYTFKHALVQDAAYDSLLKSDRQELHGNLAKAIAETMTDSVRTEPELLAHHYTQAGDAAAAVPLWQQAGERELARMSIKESILHLSQGLDLVPSLPENNERDRRELALRRTLGVAWMAAKGFAAPEARDTLLPALKLVDAANSGKEILPVYWGLWSNTLSSGLVASSARRAEEFLTIGREKSDDDLVLIGNLMMCVSLFWLGDLSTAYKHAEEVVRHYDPNKHKLLAHEINHDPMTGARLYQAMASWMLGYPDRAVQMCNAMDSHARERGHVFDLGFALAAGSDVFEYRGEPENQLLRVEECESIGRRNSLAVLWKLVAPLRRGAALVHQGKYAEGVKLMRESMAIREASGGYGGSNPYFKGLIAQGLALDGNVGQAMQIIEDQIAQIERPEWLEQCHYAEILRLKGWLLSLENEFDNAEQNYRASLDHARAQNARSWELRTAISLARLWHQQGKDQEAYDLLDPIYRWFTEGFETRDLRDAKALLAELAA